MNDKFKINQLLIQEVDSLRQRISEVEEELLNPRKNIETFLRTLKTATLKSTWPAISHFSTLLFVASSVTQEKKCRV